MTYYKRKLVQTSSTYIEIFIFWYWGVYNYETSLLRNICTHIILWNKYLFNTSLIKNDSWKLLAKILALIKCFKSWNCINLGRGRCSIIVSYLLYMSSYTIDLQEIYIILLFSSSFLNLSLFQIYDQNIDMISDTCYEPPLH